MAPSRGIVFTHGEPGWNDLTHDERIERLSCWIAFFCKAEDVAAKLLRLQPDKYQRPLRVVIDTKAQPRTIRKLEKFLRAILKADIDIVGELARDTSPLRRLSL